MNELEKLLNEIGKEKELPSKDNPRHRSKALRDFLENNTLRDPSTIKR